MSNSFKNLVKSGFGLGLGVLAAQVLFLLIGAAIFYPGYLLVMKEKKDTEDTSSKKMLGLLLMGIGVLIMGGIGFNILTENLNDLLQ